MLISSSLRRVTANVATTMLLLTTLFASRAESATAELQQAMRTATFEVVMKKPLKDPLTYEKPLPLDLLPYMERTDEYRSIGTAFSLGGNRYVTAAHVLSAGFNSQYGPPSLRDADGKVFMIEQIIKYSAHEDFAMFSVAGDPAPKGLAVNRSPAVNTVVYAVGNALGDGVIVRDGLYTSSTPEDQDGRWKWIRFSAPASPGNSGGPLIDPNGDVIGVVIGKSPNENLNYSLPISRVLDAPDNKATFDVRYLQQLPYLHGKTTHTLKSEFSLPKSWQSFSAAAIHVNEKDNAEARQELLDKFANAFFPVGAEQVLYDTDYKYDPQLIVQQQDDRWESQLPSFASTDLPGDGFVKVGSIHSVALFRLHRSNLASDAAFYGDSRQFMDLMLKGLNLTREVGSDAVRITSLGSAARDSKYTDKYGRVWQERIWPIPYLDVYVIAMVLPTPDGCVGVMEYSPSAFLNNFVSIVEDVSNLVDVSYWGTLEQWQNFLKQRDLVPRGLSKLQLHWQESNGSITLESERASIGLDSSILKMSSKSLLGINMNYGQESGKLEWKISGTRIFADAQRRSYVSLTRHQKPVAELKQEYQDDWQNLLNRRSPYDGKPNHETTDTWVGTTVLPVDSNLSGKTSDALSYALQIAVEDYISSGEMNNKFNIARGSIKILEKGSGQLVVDGNATRMESDTDEISGLKSSFAAARQYILDGAGLLTAQLTDSIHDARGRTQEDDLKEDLVSEEIKRSVQDIQLKFNKEVDLKDVYAAQQQLQALTSLTDTIRERYSLIINYWRDVRGIEREKTMWKHALENNNLPLTTAHGEDVSVAQAALDALASPKQSFDTDRAKAIHQLIVTMKSDRDRVARRAGQQRQDISLVRRKSPCPVGTHETNEDLSGDAPLATKEVKVRARLRAPIPDPDAMYPSASKRDGEEGTVVVLLQVNSTGCPVRFAVSGSSGSDALDNTALDFVELLSYYPATDDGHPTSTMQPLAVSFRLH